MENRAAYKKMCVLFNETQFKGISIFCMTGFANIKIFAQNRTHTNQFRLRMELSSYVFFLFQENTTFFYPWPRHYHYSYLSVFQPIPRLSFSENKFQAASLKGQSIKNSRRKSGFLGPTHPIFGFFRRTLTLSPWTSDKRKYTIVKMHLQVVGGEKHAYIERNY